MKYKFYIKGPKSSWNGIVIRNTDIDDNKVTWIENGIERKNWEIQGSIDNSVKYGFWKEISFKEAKTYGLPQIILNNMKTKKINSIKIIIPEPIRFKLTYQKDNGDTNDYSVLGIIGKTSDSFTAYIEGKGIRTFKNNKVVDVQ